MFRKYHSHGRGIVKIKDFKKIGDNVIFEPGVLVFHPETINIGDNVYFGHNSIIKGYHNSQMTIGNNVWIGQQVFMHSGGGLEIEDNVGIGPKVIVLTHYHREEKPDKPLIACEQIYKKVRIEVGCDIGVGAIILPGVTVGKYSIVGAGAVVTKDINHYSVVAGNPARILRMRR